MNELRSVLERLGRAAGYGRFGRKGAGAGPARHPGWLVFEILLVTILVFFWL